MTRRPKSSSDDSFEHVEMPDNVPPMFTIVDSISGVQTPLTWTDFKEHMKYLLTLNPTGLDIEKLQSAWAADELVPRGRLKDIAKNFGFSSVGAMMQDPRLSDIVMVESNENVIYKLKTAGASTDRVMSSVTRQLVEGEEFAQAHKERMKIVRRNIPYQKGKILEGKEKILEILYNLSAEEDYVPLTALQKVYKNQNKGVALNGDEFKNFFLQKSPKKVFEQFFERELDVKSLPNHEGNLTIKFKQPYAILVQMLEDEARKFCVETNTEIPIELQAKKSPVKSNISQQKPPPPQAQAQSMPYADDEEEDFPPLQPNAPPSLTTMPPRNVMAPVARAGENLSHGERYLQQSLARANLRDRSPNHSVSAINANAQSHLEISYDGDAIYEDGNTVYPDDLRTMDSSTPTMDDYLQEPMTAPVLTETFQRPSAEDYMPPSRRSIHQEAHRPGHRQDYYADATSIRPDAGTRDAYLPQNHPYHHEDPQYYDDHRPAQAYNDQDRYKHQQAYVAPSHRHHYNDEPPHEAYPSVHQRQPYPYVAPQPAHQPIYPVPPPGLTQNANMNHHMRTPSTMSLSSTISRSTAIPDFDNVASPSMVELNKNFYDLELPRDKLALAITSAAMVRSPGMVLLEKMIQIVQNLMSDEFFDPEHKWRVNWVDFIKDNCQSVEVHDINRKTYIRWKG